jgi:hypothetical protein
MTPQAQPSPAIAGSVLPIKRAEELLQTLPGVIAARIIASETGAVDEIHVLTSAEVTPKQTVRNIESALIAHLGMRVDHRKISVATTLENRKAGEREVVMPPASVASPVGEPSTRRPWLPYCPRPIRYWSPARFFEDVESSSEPDEGHFVSRDSEEG